MRAPDFWWRPPGALGGLARVLAPLAWFYELAGWLRAARTTPERIGVPVICVGNLTAGGAGKTPVVAALVRRLQAGGRRPHVLSRGYGGRHRGPHRVDPARDTHREVGDEPLMLAALAPVWVARDRVAGARAAMAAGADLIVMDDGFQNPALAKDLAILVIDAGQGLGNGRVIPAGPLREPARAALDRAHLVVLIGAPQARSRAVAHHPVLAEARPLEAELVPVRTGLPIAGEAVVAFAGIGRPEKFFETLDQMGARRVASVAFPDHHDFSDAVLARLQRQARAADAMLVTTEKDATRLPPRFRREVMAVQVAFEPEDWSPIDQALATIGLAPVGAATTPAGPGARGG